MRVQTHFCTCTDGFWTACSLLVSEEKLDDGVGFKIHLIHVGVLILHHLTDRQMANVSKTDRQHEQHVSQRWEGIDGVLWRPLVDKEKLIRPFWDIMSLGI